MSDIVAIHRSVADGSAHSQDQCPNGASLPAATLGGEVETTLICQKDDWYVFEYYGRFDDKVLSFRADRLPEAGDIAQDDGQKWLSMIAQEFVSRP
ncbi:hypothetical protein [Cryobacterium aureum]|uniref:hypothetical protein n=1 Tax=Cryobacterium aureum TaxID=995037 RepID=UPI000CF52E80|nr:hypothetical protein [Cryobacterium aureum]